MAIRLFVLGATGHIGGHVLDLALKRGLRVTAFVRSPQKIARTDGALSIVQGDPLNADQMSAALPGHDAVLSTLGPSTREAFRPSTLLAECAASTVAAMSRGGVGRLAIVSAAVLFPEKGVRFAFFRWFLQDHIRDLVAMESVVRGTDFDWTIARPPRLIESSDATYRCEHEALPAKAWSMSFRAVASFLLDSIERNEHARETVGLARGGAAS
jgi:putative NADH-flavin reductase